MLRPALALLLAATVLTGCGTDDATLSDADRAAIQKRYATYMRHLIDGKGKRVCAQFTPASRQHSDEVAHDAGFHDCAEIADLALSSARDGAPSDIEDRLAHPEGIDVSTHGERALASFRGVTAQGAMRPVSLERVGKRWLIDGTRIIIEPVSTDR